MGVDVFFVISGFLITSIILKEINAGGFSIARFYERRIRRIFPALFPVIAFALVLGFFLFYSKSFKDLGGSIAATTLFVSNLFFWRQADYFDAAAITKPLLHTWSLAVEEQFYIFFPLLLVAINLFFGKRYFVWLLCIWIVSLLTSIYGVYTYPVATFYLVPTRAWELLTGSILALGVLPRLTSEFQKDGLSLLGLGLICFSVVFYTESTAFPGASALAPVLGSGLVIYAGTGEGGRLSKYLGVRPLVFIGLISYSLYLWHWPLFVFTKYLLFRALTPMEITLIILLTFAISVVSYKVIEQPFRGARPIVPQRKKLFAVAGIVMLVASSLGIVVDSRGGMPDRFPEAEAATRDAILDMKTDRQWVNYEDNMKTLFGLSEGAIPATIGTEGAVPSFVLWGDSHAKSLVTAIAESARRYGISGYDIAHGHVIRPLLGIDLVGATDEVGYNQSVIDFIGARPEITTVILAGYWSSEIKMTDAAGEFPGKRQPSVLLKAGLTRAVEALRALGRDVVLVSDIPVLKDDPHRILFLANRFNTEPDFQKIASTAADYRESNGEIIPVLEHLANEPGVTLIRPESMLFDESGQTRIMVDNTMIYIDDDHLTTNGSRYISPIFDEVFSEMVR